MSNDSAKQAVVRASTGTAHSYNGDWHALFDAAGIAVGDFSGRMLGWINGQLSSAYTNVNEAMAAFAINQGASDWSSLGTFTIGGGSGPTGDGRLLEDGTSFRLLEDGSSFRLLE